MDLFSLKGKLAVVTGGASGIGAATVEAFERCGATVTVLDIANDVDVTDTQAVERAFARLAAFDILVNSAGRAVRKPALELSSEEWDQVLDLNLKATFFCSRAAVPHLK
jgi:NAD(P)-dependent dehydrogenase (short-subunit alcohol dehydrogenase family)